MAGNRPALRSVFETMEDYVRRRDGELRNLGREAEAVAHAAYRNAIRTGQNLSLKTQAEVNRFGADLLASRKRTPSSPTPRQTAGPSPLRQGVDRVMAAARGAQDALTLGGGDRVYAGSRALIDAAQGSSLGDAWRTRMAAERTRDAYDDEHYRTARVVGKIAGTGLGLAAMGPVDGFLAGGIRIAEATPLVAREAAALGGGGAAFGVGDQGLDDLAHRRVSSIGDYAGSAFGGAAGALAAVSGRAGQMGAIGGATTSVAKDVLNGRPVNWESAGHAALAGGYMAAPVGRAARVWSNGLSPMEKGSLGEDLGKLRTMANLRRPVAGGEPVPVGGGKVTILDEGSSKGLMSEQKFGIGNRGLTPNQKLAYELFGNRYRVDHFLPRDFGVMAAYPAGQLGYLGYGFSQDDEQY